MIHIDRASAPRPGPRSPTQGKRLMGQGNWVIMFPEGTRCAARQPGHLQDRRARLAIATGVPIVPIAVTSARCWPRKSFLLRPGVIDISIGPPIPSARPPPDELMREVETWIEAEMRRSTPRPMFPRIRAMNQPGRSRPSSCRCSTRRWRRSRPPPRRWPPPVPALPRAPPRARAHDLLLGEHRVAYELRRARRRSIGFVRRHRGPERQCAALGERGRCRTALREKQAWILRKLHEQQRPRAAPAAAARSSGATARASPSWAKP
jgi:hypothetical protein